jgi:hypothetical protein
MVKFRIALRLLPNVIRIRKSRNSSPRGSTNFCSEFEPELSDVVPHSSTPSSSAARAYLIRLSQPRWETFSAVDDDGLEVQLPVNTMDKTAMTHASNHVLCQIV